jgi:hypothetical protein
MTHHLSLKLFSVRDPLRFLRFQADELLFSLLLFRSSCLDLIFERSNSFVVDCSVLIVRTASCFTFVPGCRELTDLVEVCRSRCDVRALGLPGSLSIGRLLELGRHETAWFFVSKGSEIEIRIGGFHVGVTKRDGLGCMVRPVNLGLLSTSQTVFRRSP